MRESNNFAYKNTCILAGGYLQNKFNIITLFAANFFAVSILFNPALADQTNWDLNDVSYLLPLEGKQYSGMLLKADSSGSSGQLLPLEKYILIPRLIVQPEPAVLRQELRAIAIRIDPCFRDSMQTSNCHRQIRLVWQPIRQGNALDATVHTFYELTDAQFKSLIKELLKLKKSSKINTSGLPLQIHPALSSEGLRGPFWTRLKKIILKYAGEKNLSRMTFMTLRSPGNIWEFGGFDFDGNKHLQMAIPRIRSMIQVFQNVELPPLEFLGGPKPLPFGNSDLNKILTNSLSAKLSLNKESATLALDEIQMIENPNLSIPATIDCVNCHVAEPARHWILREFPTLNENLGINKFSAKRDYDLINFSPDPGRTNRARAFGYVKKSPSISQRTINESAAVADWLNDLN